MSSHARAHRSLLSIEDLSKLEVRALINKALQLKSGEVFPLKQESSIVAGLIFFEPSTRTRFSFEVAAHRMFINPVAFVADSTTSLSKGESLHETLNNLMAMQPNILIVRHSGDSEVETILRESSIPVINAGSGSLEHPTQALLDAMTVFERMGNIEKQKILYVGDVEYSRVANSGRKLFQSQGAEVAVCSPAEFCGGEWSQLKQFENLSEALSWSTVCIGLRIQKERHGKKSILSVEQYIEKYRLDNKNISALSSSAIIMHPGPFVAGVDISEEILQDPRCMIHEQVTNGVYMRMAIMGELLGISYT